MPTPILAQTKIRLTPYIEVRFTEHDPFFYGDGIPKEISFEGDAKRLGYVEKVDIEATRDVHLVRALDYQLAGRPAEVYPGLPDYAITLTRIVLYSDDALEKFIGSKTHEGVISQSKPLALRFNLYQPPVGDNNYTLSRQIIAYGCWMKKHPLAMDITTADLKIVQDLEITATLIKYGPGE